MDNNMEETEEIRETEAVEKELRRCLQHVPAPEGFTARVLERAAQRQDRRTGRSASIRHGLRGSLAEMPRRAWWTAAAAALVLAVGSGDALHLRHQRQDRQAAAVQAQMDLAMQLTNHALAEVETGLDRSPAGRFAQFWNGQER